MDPLQKLEICKQTRSDATQALVTTLRKVFTKKEKVSEASLRSAWLKELRKTEHIFRDGWYMPPPHGMGVLFGTDTDIGRISTASMRPEEFWPKEDRYLDFQNGIIFVYASPVDYASGIIGDFGLTIYLGSNPKIQNHLQQCLSLDKQIFEYVKVGMKFSEITEYTLKLLASHNLKNNIASPTDPTGTNIGHTIPASYEEWNEKELKLLHSENWQAVCTLISKKRKFLNSAEQQEVKSGMGFTIEPRPESISDPSIPMVFFHTIALFKEKGEKEHLTGFDEIFKIAGMNYMLT